jgi:hypothetical protein
MIKSRWTFSSRKRASRDRWSSSTLVALCSIRSVLAMTILRAKDGLVPTKPVP